MLQFAKFQALSVDTMILVHLVYFMANLALFVSLLLYQFGATTASSIHSEETRWLKDTKRSILDEYAVQCTPESLRHILESCEQSISIDDSVSPSTQANTGQSTTTIPQSFCGPNCSNLIFSYVNICNLQQFVLNVSGACKLSGSNFIMEWVHAVIIADPLMHQCMKRTLNATNPLLPIQTSQYTQSRCCSLNIAHDNGTMYRIVLDRVERRVHTQPPIEAPWTYMNLSSFQPAINVVNSELCLQPVTTEKPSQSQSPETISMNDVNVTSSEISGSYSVHCMYRLCILSLLFCLYVLSLL